MIRAESSGKSLSSASLMVLTSIGDNAVTVSCDDKPARKLVGEKWEDQPDKRTQNVSADIGGEHVEFTAVVNEQSAVDVKGPVYKVVLAMGVREELKGAFAAGRVSRSSNVVSLLQVIEVWDSPTKCLYGPQTQPGGGPTAKTLGPTGKIVSA